jgi:hypothetical protein
MNDDIDSRLREGLRGAQLPAAPEPVRDYLAELRRRPSNEGQRRRARLWVALVPIAAVLVGAVALTGGSSVQPSATSTPTRSTASTSSASEPPRAEATMPSVVEGLTIQTVSELLAARAAGDAPGGPYALRGYWTDRTYGHTCGAPLSRDGQPGELELYCSDGEWGITERNEAITDLTIQRRANETSIGGPPAAGPHLTPLVPSTDEMQPLFAVNYQKGGFWAPVPIVVVGHFDDPRAADCRKSARQLCRDRFVLDRVVTFNPDSVPAPTPSPTPTPFPRDSPPPALFANEECYRSAPKSFTGWIPFSELDIGLEGPGYVYAMVTRDVVPIGKWYANPRYPGHKTRSWGRGVCYAVDPGSVGFAAVTGTTFLEVDDGRHIEGGSP